jgi:hypothetical protein
MNYKIKCLRFRVIGYSTEQFDRVSNALISLLAHTQADYRLIAGTTLANLEKETKAIDIALLNSFLNDPRVCFSVPISLIVIVFDRFLFVLNAVIH